MRIEREYVRDNCDRVILHVICTMSVTVRDGTRVLFDMFYRVALCVGELLLLFIQRKIVSLCVDFYIRV